jgi:hypothetical protein
MLVAGNLTPLAGRLAQGKAQQHDELAAGRPAEARDWARSE